MFLAGAWLAWVVCASRVRKFEQCLWPRRSSLCKMVPHQPPRHGQQRSQRCIQDWSSGRIKEHVHTGGMLFSSCFHTCCPRKPKEGRRKVFSGGALFSRGWGVHPDFCNWLPGSRRRSTFPPCYLGYFNVSLGDRFRILLRLFLSANGVCKFKVLHTILDA